MNPVFLKRSDFPSGFDFGVKSSAYKIKNYAFASAGKTHWYNFEKLPGRVFKSGQIACDHYNKYQEDFDNIKAAVFLKLWVFKQLGT